MENFGLRIRRNSNKKFAKKSRVDNNNDWEDKNDSGWDEIELPNEDENKILDDMENEYNNQLNLKEKIETIFEYLRRLDDNERSKIKASIKAAQLVFIDSAPYKARTIHYWANYWLQCNHFPISCQGKHQKITRLIYDEDIVEECHTWIRSQGGKTTLLKFKTFIEQKLHSRAISLGPPYFCLY
ncbi:hypothetical protein RhiirA4_476773 [Rhizophagus irregularis]|uniref:Uncharacterized protein n=1 Tax=Rhizophagus irregularis TaxID=588596 RepID=A0A2I1HC54_9GLOM|nr:hypothetical protein RhiirA4_476773 [Rhizophagus irregularis]